MQATALQAAGLLMMTTPSEGVHEIRNREEGPVAAAVIPGCSDVRCKAQCACTTTTVQAEDSSQLCDGGATC